MAQPILIWGAGAIGGTVGAYWARAGVDVLLVDANAEHVERCNQHGLSIEGPVEQFTVPVRATTPEELEGRWSRIVLAVKAQHTAAALDGVVEHLAADGYVLSAQNGLNEIAIAQRVGEQRTIGAFVNFGADWHAPGRILYGNRGAVVVGEIDGETRTRTRELHRLLQRFEPEAALTEDVWGYLWGKIGYGAMLFAAALTNDTMSENFCDPERESIWITLGRESMSIALARGVQPRGFNGFDPKAFYPDASCTAARKSIAALADFNRHTAKTRSGVWRDIAVRRRPTEAQGFFPIVLSLAREAQVEAPALTLLADLIGQVERGEREQSLQTLMQLKNACVSSLKTTS